MGLLEEPLCPVQSSGVGFYLVLVLVPGHRLTPVVLAAARSRVRMGVSRSISLAS